MSKMRVVHTPTFKEYVGSNVAVMRRLEAAGVAETYLWDYNYWYVSLEDWGRIFQDVLLNLPKYSLRFDCENFALLTSARVAEKYRLNSCGIAIGKSPFGEHGYNLFVARIGDKSDLFILEPQTGMVYPITEPEGYEPRLVILG